MKRLAVLVLVVLIAVGGGYFLLGSGPSPDDLPAPIPTAELTRPNILLISMDTTRADHLSAMGYEIETTPHLRALAENGARFHESFSPTSTTGPSHATMFTGQYPVSHGVIKNGMELNDAHTTLAEIARDAGYETAGFVSSFVLNRKFGYNQGFEYYDDSSEEKWVDSLKRKVEWDDDEHKHQDGNRRPAEATSDSVIRWLKAEHDPDMNFFMFIHYFDPHAPLEPPESFVEQIPELPEGATKQEELNRLYDAEILYTDYHMQRVFKTLEDMQIADDTIVIVTADHGEGLGEHDNPHHGNNIYDEAVHVAFIVSWPGTIQPQNHEAGPVESTDIVSTAAELAGFELPEGNWQGRSLAPVLRGEAELDKDRPVYLLRRHYKKNESKKQKDVGVQYGLRQSGWKYIWGPDEETLELYNLVDDPDELVNLYDAEVAQRDAMVSALDAFLQENAENYEAPQSLSDDDREALEALGYIE